MGRLGDRFGHKRLFVTGLGIYTGGLALSAASPGIEALIFFRGIQGVGAAMTTALSVALVTSAFPREERGKAIGTLQSAAGIGLMAGPAMGGLILDAMGWRAIFLLRVPLGLAAALFAMAYMKGGAEQRTGARFDASGAVALIVGLSSFAVAVTQGPSLGWGSPQVVSLAVTSALALMTFFVIERRVPYPVMDFGLFKSRPFAVANVLALLYAALSMAGPFLMPFYLMGALALSASAAGLILLTNPLILMLASPLTGRLSDRYGPRWITVVGLTMYAVSLFLLSTLHTASAPLLVAAFLGMAGLGGALFSTPNTSAIMGAAPSDRIGSVSALIPTVRNIGLIVRQMQTVYAFLECSWSSPGSSECLTMCRITAFILSLTC